MDSNSSAWTTCSAFTRKHRRRKATFSRFNRRNKHQKTFKVGVLVLETYFKKKKHLDDCKVATGSQKSSKDNRAEAIACHESIEKVTAARKLTAMF